MEPNSGGRRSRSIDFTCLNTWQNGTVQARHVKFHCRGGVPGRGIFLGRRMPFPPGCARQALFCAPLCPCRSCGNSDTKDKTRNSVNLCHVCRANTAIAVSRPTGRCPSLSTVVFGGRGGGGVHSRLTRRFLTRWDHHTVALKERRWRGMRS